MRTITILLFFTLLSTCAHIFVEYRKPPLNPDRPAWETGAGSQQRTHTTGHGYYLRRAERGK